MEESPLAPGVRRLTVNLDSDDVALFEDLWPVPNGVALHCYLIQGERAVLIDPWDAGGYGVEELEVDLKELGLSWNEVAAVAFTKAPAPGAEAALRAAQPHLAFWGPPTPGARHDLGGALLEECGGFWLHSASGMLFTGDTFAGLGWVEDERWTEDLGEHEARYFEDEALRWFSARPLVAPVPAAARFVAPAHGCLWKSPPAAEARARRFASWAEEGLEEVTIVWPEGADQPLDALISGVLELGAGLNLYRVPQDDATALAAGARRAQLVVVAAGIETDFLRGLTKDVWAPSPLASPEELRQGVIDRWTNPTDRSFE